MLQSEMHKHAMIVFRDLWPPTWSPDLLQLEGVVVSTFLEQIFIIMWVRAEKVGGGEETKL